MKKESLYEAGAALMLLAAVYPVFLLNAYAGTGVLLVGGALAGNRCGIHGSLRRFALGIFFSLALTAVWSTAFWRDPRELGTAYQIAVLESWMFICMEEEITPQLKLHLITLAALAAWSIYFAYFNTALLLKRRRALFGLLLSAELVFVGMWAASAYTPVALLYSYPNYRPLNSKVVPAAVAALLFLWAIRNLRHPERRSWRNVAWCAGGFAVFSLVAWTISATAMFVYSGRLLERTEYLADRRPTAPKDLYREMADLEARLPPPKGTSLPVIGADFWHPQNGGEVVSDEIKKRTLEFAGSAAGEEYFALAKRYFELCQRSVGEYRYTDAGQRSEALINCIFAIRLIEMTAALAHYRGDAEQVLPLLDQLKKLEQAVYSHGDILGQLNGEIISGDRLRFIVACGPDRPEYAPHYRVLLKDCRKNCFRPRANGEAREELENIRRFRPAKYHADQSSLYSRILLYPMHCADLAYDLNASLRIAAEAEKYEYSGAPPLPDRADVIHHMFAKFMRWQAESRTQYSIALALKTFRCEKGAYPETLDELVPEYLDRLPVLPDTGAVPEYRKLPDGAFKLPGTYEVTPYPCY